MRSQSFRHKGISWIAALGLTLTGLLISSTEAIAAERVVMRYGPFQRSASVEELAHFVETGETTRQLRAYFRMSGQDPEQFRQLLSREVEVDVVTLDRLLNNPVGDVMLDRMGRFVHTPSGDANREAMRSALVLSASDGGRISLIEVMQNYPTRQIHIDGNEAVAAYRQISTIQQRADSIRRGLSGILETLGVP
ncbi:alpha/beta hydrolase [Egbenema bharatensis]|uniref:alpha/beta hydrolase n=1 Tax=Egbenema bharatensis TaxID=3463334 RepID=UPI003A8A646E